MKPNHHFGMGGTDSDGMGAGARGGTQLARVRWREQAPAGPHLWSEGNANPEPVCCFCG